MVYICQLLVHLLLQSKVITHHQEATDILEWKKRTLFRVSIYVFVWHSKLRNSIAGYIHRPHLLSIRYPIHQRSPSCYPLQEVVCVEGFKYQGSLTDENESTKIIHFYTIHSLILRSLKMLYLFQNMLHSLVSYYGTKYQLLLKTFSWIHSLGIKATLC